MVSLWVVVSIEFFLGAVATTVQGILLTWLFSKKNWVILEKIWRSVKTGVQGILITWSEICCLYQQHIQQKKHFCLNIIIIDDILMIKNKTITFVDVNEPRTNNVTWLVYLCVVLSTDIFFGSRCDDRARDSAHVDHHLLILLKKNWRS